MRETPGDTSTDVALPRAVIAGAVAALVGGGLWALVVIGTKYEVGWLAWGVGALVGVVMSRATPARGQTVALLGAVIAGIGLLSGKALIAAYTVSARSVTQEIVSDSTLVLQAASWHLDTEIGWPEGIQTQLDALGGDDTLSDALWQEMMAASAAHAGAWTSADSSAIAAAYADAILVRLGTLDRLRMQFGLWDLLWFGLAVVTAFRILRAGPQPSPDPSLPT
ncbi:MAG TPA: hypothetical protein VGA02_04690 [Gemmatimonadales bacterium]|jgi:hypothetical protein